MSTTIRDVAFRAGVSVTTASRVLSGSDHPVAAELRKRVLLAAHELGFTPNAFARGLSKREFRIIGLLIPDVRDPYFVEIARGAEDVASQHGHMVVLCNTDRDPAKERKYLDELRAMRAGIILTGGGINREAHLDVLSTHSAPIVLIGRHSLPYSSVEIDNVLGAFDATSHLISLGRGSIAFIGGPHASATATDRLEGYRKAMTHHGIAIDESLVVESDFTTGGGATALCGLLALPKPPAAVFAASDAMAIGAMREAKRRGLFVPRDLAIAGFNDIPMAVHVDPPLTTIHLPLHQIGETAATLLL